jgi:hypothetical protein
MKMTVYWDVAPYSLVERTDISEVLTASIIITVTIEAVSTPEMLIHFYMV